MNIAPSETPEQAPDSPEPRLVALDIDGTLIDTEQRMAPDVRDVVADIATRAHVVLATGRCVVATKIIADRLGLSDGYAVCSNGAVIARVGSFEPIHVSTFDPAPAVRALLDLVPDVLVGVEELGIGYRVNAPFPPGDLNGLQRVEPIDSLVAAKVPRVVVNRPGWTAAEMHAALAGSGLHGVAYAVGSTAWLDLTPEGITKAAALDQVRQWLGVRQAETIAFGDGQNDIEMLRWAGVGLAMANAPDEVAAAADAVVGSVHEGAVATELRRRFR